MSEKPTFCSACYYKTSELTPINHPQIPGVTLHLCHVCENTGAGTYMFTPPNQEPSIREVLASTSYQTNMILELIKSNRRLGSELMRELLHMQTQLIVQSCSCKHSQACAENLENASLNLINAAAKRNYEQSSEQGFRRMLRENENL